MARRKLVARCYQSLDGAKLGFLVFFVIVLNQLLVGPGRGLADSDYFWHLAAGEVIVANGGLLSTDVFSYTFEGLPWVMHEWLFELALYLVYSSWGEQAIAVGVALLLAGAWYAAYQSARLFLPSAIGALACSLLFLPGILAFVTPRPHLISFLFFAWFLRALLTVKYRNVMWPLYALPVAMALWVNLHGGYVVGLALLFAFVLAEGATALGTGASDYRRRSVWYGVTFLAALAGSAVNPDGITRWLYPFQVMGMEVSQMINEWKPQDLGELPGLVILGLGLVFLVVVAYRRRPPDLLELALPVSIFIAGMTSVRHVTFAALTLIPFLAQAIAEGGLTRLIEGPFVFLKKPIGAAGKIWSTAAVRLAPSPGDKGIFVVHWILAALVFFVGTPVILAHDPSFSTRDTKLPVAAVDFIEANDIDGRMYNNYALGGYLIFRLYPERKVFIDGRADLYGDEFVGQYADAQYARGAWREQFDEWEIDYAILMTKTPLYGQLSDDGEFVELFNDETYAILVRHLPRFAALIENAQSEAAPENP